MRFGKDKKVVVIVLLAAFAASLFVSPAVQAQQKSVNLSKGRTLGIGVGATLPIPLGVYLVYWLDDEWGITGSGYLFGQSFALSGSLLYKFGDNPRLDYLMQGSFGYYQTGIFASYMSVGAGVGLEYSFFKSLAVTGSATVSLGLGPTISILPGISGGIVFYFM